MSELELLSIKMQLSMIDLVIECGLASIELLNQREELKQLILK